MSDPTTPPGSKGPSPIAMIALLFFFLAAIADQTLFSEPHFARKHVEVKSNERIQAQYTDADGVTKTAWLEPTDGKIVSGEWKPVGGVAAAQWTTRPLVTEKEYDAVPAALAANPGAAPGRTLETSPVDTLGVWVAAFLTLAIFSFLWRDNPVYKVAESLLVGVSAGYWMVNGFWTALVPKLIAPLAPGFTQSNLLPDLQASSTPGLDFALALVPLTLGFLLLWRLAPRGGWISVWPLAFIIGTTAGLKVISSVEADLLPQSLEAMKPLVVFSPQADDAGKLGFDFWMSLSSLVGVVGVLSVLVYFFFSVEHKGAVGKTARVGIWFLMVTFGSAFGLTVMGRITLLSQRFEFLFTDWLRIG
ncbi:MAG: hypothetical protein ACO3QC_01275 [Phycisphaerales bacterium]